MKTVVMRRRDREKKNAAEGYAMPIAGWSTITPMGCASRSATPPYKLGITEMERDKYQIEGEAHVLELAHRDTDQESDRRVKLATPDELGAEPKGGSDENGKTLREELEDARHQARGTTTPSIGRRVAAKR